MADQADRDAAEQLTENLIQAMRANPRTTFLHALSEDALGRRVLKQELWEWIQRNEAPDSGTDLYGEELRDVMVGHFFDKALYHAVRGYEETWTKEGSLRRFAAFSAEHGATRAIQDIARAVLGELEGRRAALDGDLILRSATLVVALEPVGKLRSITVRQESETERPR